MSSISSPTLPSSTWRVRHEATTLSIDSLVREAAQRRLRSSGYANSLRRIDIQFAHGELTLEGVVSSYYYKQIAQEVLRNLEHVRRVNDKLEVHWSE